MTVVGSLLVSLLFGAPESVSLTTLAAASPRPPVCRPVPGATDSELWSRARREPVHRFCLLLSRGYARLRSAPNEALALAREAAGILPKEVEANVLAGRALLRLGDANGAREALTNSVLAPGRPLGDLAAIRELGVSLGQTGDFVRASEVYRVLVPRVGFLRDGVFARVAVLETAAALMASDAPAGLGAAEAALYLTEARRAKPIPGFQDLTLAFLALALDRSGKGDQAAVVLEELSSIWALERFLSESDRARVAESLSLDASHASTEARFPERTPILAEGELHAAIGFAAFRSDPKLAIVHLSAALAARRADTTFSSWVRKRLAALGAPHEQ